MKKSIFCCFLLALVLLLPFGVDAKEKVVITDVKKTIENGRHEPFSEPKFDGLTLNINGTFVEVGDSVVYEITFENKDNVDHRFIDKDLQCSEGATCSPGISYSKNEYINIGMLCPLENEVGDDYTLEANSKTKCNLIISYLKDVPDSELKDDKFVSNTVVEIKIDDNEIKEENIISSLKNPQTFSNFIIMMLPAVIAILGSILIFRKKKKVGTFMFIIGMFVIPVSVLASQFVTIKVNSNIEIRPIAEFCYVDKNGQYSYHKFRYGMDWITFMNGDYNNGEIPFYVMPENPTIDWGSVSGNYNLINSYGPPAPWTTNSSFTPVRIKTELETIKPKDEHCYMGAENN